MDLMKEAGGSQEELEDFIKLAENHYLDVGASNWGSDGIRSRKITEFFWR